MRKEGDYYEEHTDETINSSILEKPDFNGTKEIQKTKIPTESKDLSNHSPAGYDRPSYDSSFRNLPPYHHK